MSFLSLFKPVLAWVIGVFTKDLVGYLGEYMEKRREKKEQDEHIAQLVREFDEKLAAKKLADQEEKK